MFMNELISVIVPVYNVFEYLEECFKAICEQTYKNIEIILVDDGSTDESGKLCDFLAEGDCRVRVLHKNNGGLSSARNAGITIATGQYLLFIDSDDYPRLTMIECLYDCLNKTNSDIACCDFSSSVIAKDRDGNIEVIGHGDAISRLFDDAGYKCYAWNKLYKKELFNNITYPEGEWFEDIKTTYNLFTKTDKICYLHKDLYYYRIRQGSITSSAYSDKNVELINAIDYVKLNAALTLERKQYLRLLTGYISYYFMFIKGAYIAGKQDCYHVCKLRKLIKQEVYTVLKSEALFLKNKIQLILFAYFPVFYIKLLKMKNKDTK